MEQEPVVLVAQLQGLRLLHQVASKVGASIRESRLEDWGADPGPSGKETFRGVP
jgi:hypothetical protein